MNTLDHSINRVAYQFKHLPFLISILLALFLFAGYSLSHATNHQPDGKLMDDKMREELRLTTQLYFSCVQGVAMKYAPENFFPQDIADAAIARCSSALSTNRKLIKKHLTALYGGDEEAERRANQEVSDTVAGIIEHARGLVIDTVLSVRSRKPK